MAAAAVKVANPGSLTKDESLDLLHELTSAFGVSQFQARLADFQQRYFRAAPGKERNKLNAERSKLYLEVQGPVLPRYGFSADAKGVFMMWQALMPHSQDQNWLTATGLLNVACRQDAQGQLLEPRGPASPPPSAPATARGGEALQEVGGWREGEPHVSRFRGPPSLEGLYPCTLFNGIGSHPVVHGDYIIGAHGPHLAVFTLDLEVKWRWRLGYFGNPTGVGSRMCTTNYHGFAFCFCLDTGKRLWRRKFCAVAGDGMDPRCRATPAAGGLLLAIGSAEGIPANGIDGVFALSLADGSEVWRIALSSLYSTIPVAVADHVVVRDTLDGVSCLSLRTGTLLWYRAGDARGLPEHHIPQDVTASQALGLVCTCLLGRKAPAWNKRSGGTGAVLALELATGRERWKAEFELEAHVQPVILADLSLVVACLGNRCGPPEGLEDPPEGREPRKVVGDSFPGMVVGLSAKDGSRIWTWEPPVWTKPAAAGVSKIRATDVEIKPWTPPVACADGRVYSCFHSGMMYAIDGATGKEAYNFDMVSCPLQRVVLGEGALVCFQLRAHVFRWPQPGPRIEQPLVAPFEETGTEHFFPYKNSRNDHTLTSTYKGPLLLKEPTWAFEAPSGDRRQQLCWYCNPVIDSQRNVYNGTEFGWMYVHRPDGTLRGSVYLGPRVTTPVIAGREMFVANVDGFALKVSLDTLEVLWCTRYAQTSSEDTWMPSLSKELVLVGGTWTRGDPPHPTLDPAGKGLDPDTWSHNWFVVALGRETGDRRWVFPVPWMVYNLNPTYVWYGEHEVAIIMDNIGGLYLVLCSTGEVIWRREPFAWDTFHDICGVTMGPNKVIYFGTQDREGPEGYLTKYPQNTGIIEAFDVSSFPPKKKWMVKKPFAGMLQSVVAPLEDGGSVLVVPMGNNGDLPSETVEERRTDAFTGIIYGLDPESGEELWSFMPPVWKTETGSCRASTIYTTYLPASWCSPVVDGRGTLYIYWMGGIMYTFEAATGRVLSSYDMGCCITGSPAVGPGMVVVQAQFRVLVWRDEELEDQWLEEAAAAGDPRAKVDDPQEVPTPKDAAKPEAAKPAAAKPPPAKSEAAKPAAAKAKPEAAKPEVAKPEAVKPEAAKLKVAKPEVVKPEAVKPEAEKPQRVDGERRYVVVGGEKSGGISVRMGASLKSTEMIERLATGAEIRELEVAGERVRYAKVSGVGPDHGWVSKSFKGTPLLRLSAS